MLVVVGIVHLVQEVDGEAPRQAALRYKRMLRSKRHGRRLKTAHVRFALPRKKLAGDGFLTESSFSAVGLFLGFLVRDDLTKLWKVGDLREQDGHV